MRLIERKMNLFELPKDYTLVHCISADCVMGMGIAKIFDEKFKGMKEDVYRTLKYNNLKYPATIMFIGEDQYVFNMVTKERYWHKPKYKDFEKSLEQLVYLCKQYNIKKLGMPKIGCGLDKLQWDIVKCLIERQFADTDIEIIICYL